MQAQALLQNTQLTRFIKSSKVLELACFSRATLWRLVKAGRFPAPSRLGPNCVAWRESDYEAWAADPEGWGK